jgi:transposase
MPTPRLQLTRHLTYEELTGQFRACRDGLAKVRWQALWLLSRPDDPYSADQAAEVVGLTADAIRKLVKRYNASGPQAVVRNAGGQGRTRRLTEQDCQELERLLLTGATAHGWPNNLWTCDRIAQLIEKHFAIKYHPGQVYKILKMRLKWSCQRPKQVNIKHDDIEIARWVREDFPRIVQDAITRRAYIAFVDETGFMLEPTLRRTWAPRGHTPVNKVSNPHARISAIGAIAVSPRPRRLELVYHLLADNVNFRGPAIAQYLSTLHSILAAPVTVVWDRTAIHDCEAVDQQLAKEPTIAIEPFPAHASELNPADGIWRYIKYGRLGNYTPSDLNVLRRTVEDELTQLKRRPDLLKSFIRFTKLPIDVE